jgi:hypothetical protein
MMQNSYNSSEPVPKKVKTSRTRISTESSSKNLVKCHEIALEKSTRKNNETNTTTDLLQNDENSDVPAYQARGKGKLFSLLNSTVNFY